VATVDIGSGFLGIFEFLGFGQVDRVRITATGALTDPTFDNLTFNGFSPIPLPPAGLLLMAGMAGMLLLRRGEGLTCTSVTAHALWDYSFDGADSVVIQAWDESRRS
jgi:hypothetical protein